MLRSKLTEQEITAALEMHISNLFDIYASNMRLDFCKSELEQASDEGREELLTKIKKIESSLISDHAYKMKTQLLILGLIIDKRISIEKVEKHFQEAKAKIDNNFKKDNDEILSLAKSMLANDGECSFEA